MVIEKEIKSQIPVNDPVLHDLIVSCLHYKQKEVWDICKTIPQIKDSKLFKPGAFWKFYEPRKEHPKFLNDFGKYVQRDGVWFFKSSREKENQDEYYLPPDALYIITHEVKTGKYNVDDILNKYYSGLDSQIWIWGWQAINIVTFPQSERSRKTMRRGFIKQLPLEYLLPIVIPKLSELSYKAMGNES